MRIEEVVEAEAPIVARKRHSKSAVVEANSSAMVESEEREINKAAGKNEREHASASIFKRPFCTDFLKFCFERFEVTLWSSAREHNIEGVLTNITDGSANRNKLLFIWAKSGAGCCKRTSISS
ncbi:uncharacterized protein LOC125200067 [Salvia hispanica]|uniref:uncharacterized protein LOC125200067 n=1 Tax=Salvia hispanica TaxID=49212 RepID=UPI0020097502|nr:uncharacterized protein LOC125200067 [Salvia hispanica]